MIGYRELKELTNGGIAVEVAKLIKADDGDAANEKIRSWWADRGVDYGELQTWAVEQAMDDVEMAQVLYGQVIPGNWMGSALATAYELGSWAGFRLATEATAKA